jgi:two-component system, chemotaxis family, protein-glutamate methylesterase/glutaminase
VTFQPQSGTVQIRVRKGKPSMRRKGRNIIVVGTSAGGLEALDELIGQLPKDLGASLLIVQHMAPPNSGEALMRRLSRHKLFAVKLAKDGERVKPGRIYIAPPDHHLLLKTDKVLVRKGARENRSRPAVDPLFRSAAVAHGSRVIGVILTGMLDDGTAGLVAIKRCGGVTVVQDPNDAAYPGMPQSALDNLKVDFCVPIAEMGQLLATLVAKPHGKTKPIPGDVRTEAEIAERVSSDIAQVERLGSQVPYNCPNCGGVLWEMDAPVAKRYRCHTGHAFTATALLASQSEKIEEMLWISLRMFEERKNLLNSMAKTAVDKNEKRSNLQRLGQTNGYIDRIRSMLVAPQSQGPEDTFRKVKGLMAEPTKAKSAR